MWQILRKKAEMPTADRALPGRAKPASRDGQSISSTAIVSSDRSRPASSWRCSGMGCFWGAERMFWKRPALQAVTAVERSRAGMTAHAGTVE